MLNPSPSPCPHCWIPLNNILFRVVLHLFSEWNWPVFFFLGLSLPSYDIREMSALFHDSETESYLLSYWAIGMACDILELPALETFDRT